MDAGRSFTWMFSQEGWIGKVLIGGLLFFIPIIGWLFIAGYLVRTLGVICAGEDRLPEWTDWGDLLVKGIIVAIAAFLYGLPGTILQTMGADFLIVLWNIAVQIIFAAAMVRYVTSGENIAAFWDFSWIFKFIQDNLGNYVFAFVLALIAGFLAVFGVVFFLVGIVFTIFWAWLVMAHLYGQVYRLSPTR